MNLIGGNNMWTFYDCNNRWSFNATIGSLLNEKCGSSLWNVNEPHTMVGNAKSIFIWGSNAVESHVQMWHFIKEIQAEGATLVSSYPVCSATALECDIHVPLRPVSDTALVMAMTNVIIEEDLIDYDFLKSRSVVPFLVKEDGMFLTGADVSGRAPGIKADEYVVVERDGSLAGADKAKDPQITRVDKAAGIKVTTAYDITVKNIEKFTPEYASDICDVDADTIRDIARLYADGPSSILAGFGFTRWMNGANVGFAMSFMGALTGNLAKPGVSMGTAINASLIFSNDKATAVSSGRQA